jgi:hypothetical protein
MRWLNRTWRSHRRKKGGLVIKEGSFVLVDLAMNLNPIRFLGYLVLLLYQLILISGVDKAGSNIWRGYGYENEPTRAFERFRWSSLTVTSIALTKMFVRRPLDGSVLSSNRESVSPLFTAEVGSALIKQNANERKAYPAVKLYQNIIFLKGISHGKYSPVLSCSPSN